MKKKKYLDRNRIKKAYKEDTHFEIQEGLLTKIAAYGTPVSILIAFCVLMVGGRTSALILAVQSAVFIVANQIAESGSSAYRGVTKLGLILIIPFVIILLSETYVINGASYLNSQRFQLPSMEEFDLDKFLNSYTELIWPDHGLATKIPDPEVEYGKDLFNSDEFFSVTLQDIEDGNYFQEYIDRCSDMGYTVDCELQGEDNSSQYYQAYNEEGYKLVLYYESYAETVEISLNLPIGNKIFEWSDSDIAQSIPRTKSNTGSVETDDDEYFSVYVTNMTLEDYKQYVQACKDAGFTSTYDYEEEENYYYLEKDDYELNLSYEGFNTVYIEVYVE